MLPLYWASKQDQCSTIWASVRACTTCIQRWSIWFHFSSTHFRRSLSEAKLSNCIDWCIATLACFSIFILLCQMQSRIWVLGSTSLSELMRARFLSITAADGKGILRSSYSFRRTVRTNINDSSRSLWIKAKPIQKVLLVGLCPAMFNNGIR